MPSQHAVCVQTDNYLSQAKSLETETASLWTANHITSCQVQYSNLTRFKDRQHSRTPNVYIHFSNGFRTKGITEGFNTFPLQRGSDGRILLCTGVMYVLANKAGQLSSHIHLRITHVHNVSL